MLNFENSHAYNIHHDDNNNISCYEYYSGVCRVILNDDVQKIHTKERKKIKKRKKKQQLNTAQGRREGAVCKCGISITKWH